jgi:hypothetical protein
MAVNGPSLCGFCWWMHYDSSSTTRFSIKEVLQGVNDRTIVARTKMVVWLQKGGRLRWILGIQPMRQRRMDWSSTAMLVQYSE